MIMPVLWTLTEPARPETMGRPDATRDRMSRHMQGPRQARPVPGRRDARRRRHRIGTDLPPPMARPVEAAPEGQLVTHEAAA